MRYDLFFYTLAPKAARQQTLEALQEFKGTWPGAPEDGTPRIHASVTERSARDNNVLVCIVFAPPKNSNKEWVEQREREDDAMREEFLNNLQTLLVSASGITRVRIENHYGTVLRRERRGLRLQQTAA